MSRSSCRKLVTDERFIVTMHIRAISFEIVKELDPTWREIFIEIAAARDTAVGVHHFSPGSLVKNRVEPIARIPRCSSRLESTRVDSPGRPRVIREKCAVKMEQKGGSSPAP